MTILKRGADSGLSTRFMIRPNAGEGEMFAHLLLLPIFERALPARIKSYRARLCRDTGYREPEAAAAVAGERRSTAHLLAMHAVHCLARPMREIRPFRGTPAFRGLQLHCLSALDRIAEMEAFGGAMKNPDSRTQLDRLADIWFARRERELLEARGRYRPDYSIDPDLDPACASLCAAIPATPPMPRRRDRKAAQGGAR